MICNKSTYMYFNYAFTYNLNDFSCKNINKKLYFNKMSRLDFKTHKLYRLYRSDIWGNLGRKRKYNFMTNMVFLFAKQNLRRHLSAYPKFLRKRLIARFPRKPIVANKLHDLTKFVKRNKSRIRGNLMKSRKILSLFYDRKLRSKTWRRVRVVSSHRIPKALTYTAYLEHRIDVLLIRACFVDSIFAAKNLVFSGHAYDLHRQSIHDPSVSLKPYEIFAIKSKTKEHLDRIYNHLKNDTLLCKPSYLWINYDLLFSFLTENIKGRLVAFSFSMGGTLSSFRNSFRVLYSIHPLILSLIYKYNPNPRYKYYYEYRADATNEKYLMTLNPRFLKIGRAQDDVCKGDMKVARRDTVRNLTYEYVELLDETVINAYLPKNIDFAYNMKYFSFDFFYEIGISPKTYKKVLTYMKYELDTWQDNTHYHDESGRPLCPRQSLKDKNTLNMVILRKYIWDAHDNFLHRRFPFFRPSDPYVIHQYAPEFDVRRRYVDFDRIMIYGIHQPYRVKSFLALEDFNGVFPHIVSSTWEYFIGIFMFWAIAWFFVEWLKLFFPNLIDNNRRD